MRYEVKALRGSEGPTALTLDAPDANDAATQAVAQGYTVIAVKAKQSWQTWRQPRKASFPLVLFSQELLALLDAGLALVEALETLAEKEQRPEVKKTLAQIVAWLYEGHPLSYALQHSAANFPPLYVASVRASEKTGALPEALARYIAYQSQMDSVKRQVVSASIYPVLLAVVGGLVAMFLMLYVVPLQPHLCRHRRRSPLHVASLDALGEFYRQSRPCTPGGHGFQLCGTGLCRHPAVFQAMAERQAVAASRPGRAFASLPAGAFLSFPGHAAAWWNAGGQGLADGFWIAATVPARSAGAGGGEHPRRTADFVFDGALRPHHPGGAAHAARG